VTEARGGGQHPQLRPVFQRAGVAAATERRQNAFNVFRRRAELPQNRADGLALFGNDDVFTAIAGGSGFCQQRDVLGHHARFESDIGIGFPFGGVIQFEVIRCRRLGAGKQRHIG